MSGGGLLENNVTANIAVDVPLTAFGEVMVAEPTSIINLQFPYNINTDIVSTTTANGGTVTQANSFAVLQTSAANNGSAEFSSKKAIHYFAGQGVSVKFTAIFTTGVADNTQIVGIGDSDDGFFFGYNGATFGILHRNATANNWIAQDDWNVDIMKGAGVSGMTLNPTKGNVYWIQFQWLGFGAINFYIEDQFTGTFQQVHQIKYANQNTAVTLTNPTLPLHAKTINSGNASNITLKVPSFVGFIEGKETNGLLRNCITNRKTGITTELNILTIRNNSTFVAKTNKVRVFPDAFSAGITGTGDTIIRVKLNATLGGIPAYTNINANTSVVAYDVAGTTVTGGRLLYAFMVDGNSTSNIDASYLELQLNPGDILTISGENYAGGAGVAINVSVSWKEQF